MFPGNIRWWPFLGVLAFLWIVPAAFGFGFHCNRDHPQEPPPVTNPPVTDPETNDSSMSVSTSTPQPTNGWVSALFPVLAGAGFLISRLRREDF